MQGGLCPADSVLGTLLVEDGGSEIETQNNLHSLRSTHSENALPRQDPDSLALLQEPQDPSYQASIVPNESANGVPSGPSETGFSNLLNS